MNFRSFILCLITLGAAQLHAQNLVTNWSFEDFEDCPPGLSYLSNATNWTSFRLTPDLLSECASPESGAGVPVSGYFIEPSEPLHGSSYGGFFQLSVPSLFSEVMGVELNESLQVGVNYYLSFYARRAYTAKSNCYSDKIGASFTMNSYADWPLEAAMPIPSQADVLHEESLEESGTWTKIEGWFLADSAYTHLAIGNMFNPEELNVVCTEEVANYSVYYFVDCVCVSQSEELCNSLVTGITERSKENNVLLFPNPAVDIIHFSGNAQQVGSLCLYSSDGKLVKQESQVDRNQVDVSNLCPGLYFIKLNLKDQSKQIISFIKQ